MLVFKIDKQKIKRMDATYVVADSYNYLEASFIFSSEWNELSKTAVFRNGSDTYSQLLSNDICIVPHEVLKEGMLSVSVFGSKGDIVELITADRVEILVHESGYEEGQTPLPPTPDVYADILEKLEGLSGGTADQVLTKKSDAPFDYGFEDPQGGGGGTSTIAWLPEVDVNGDISWRRSSTEVPPETQNIKGPKGDQGIQGPAGVDGKDGQDGAQGPKGDKGDTGETGAQGPKGDTGATGEQGPKGDKGDTGATGEQGPKGDKGDTGSQGPAGADGEDGKSAYEIAVEHGYSGTEEEWLASLVGAQGPKGDTGATGPKGDQGIQGPKGDTGETGPAGADGQDGAKGDKGDKGDTGATGPQGPAGQNGANGQDGADGVSVTNVSINASNHLIVTLSDGTDVDAGLMPELSSETVTVSGGEATKQLTSHKLCFFDGLVLALTITLPASISIGDEFNFIFVTSSNGCTLTVPNTVKWDGGETPELEANTLYEVSIDGLGIALISQGVSMI